MTKNSRASVFNYNEFLHNSSTKKYYSRDSKTYELRQRSHIQFASPTSILLSSKRRRNSRAPGVREYAASTGFSAAYVEPKQNRNTEFSRAYPKVSRRHDYFTLWLNSVRLARTLISAPPAI